MKQETLKSRVRHVWRNWVRPVLLILIVCGSVRSVVADWNDVPTGSMNPTIVEGDRIFVNKMAYGLRVPFTEWRLIDFAEPKRGEIVVFFSPDDGIRMVKRVIGLPGDTIELRHNRLIINGEPVSYGPYAAHLGRTSVVGRSARQYTADEVIDGQIHAIIQTAGNHARRNFGPFKVSDDQYFVMGDNRDNSRDSRWFGAVDRDSIVGRVSSVIFSLDLEHYYLPRTDRFFHALQ